MEGEKIQSVCMCHSRSSGQLGEWDNGSSGKHKQMCHIKQNFEFLVNFTIHMWIYPLVSIAVARSSVQTTIIYHRGAFSFQVAFPQLFLYATCILVHRVANKILHIFNWI